MTGQSRCTHVNTGAVEIGVILDHDESNATIVSAGICIG